MFRSNVNKKILVIILVGLFFIAQTVFAQLITDNVSLSASPPTPSPGEMVKVSATSLSLDLNASDILWSLNGVVRARNIGMRTFTFIAGDTGSTHNISITVIPLSGASVTKSLVVKVSEVDLIWEADSYTPPFYKGKALSTAGSNIRITAVPNIFSSSGVKISAGSLIYSWSFNGSSISEKSGYGKNVFDFRTSPRTNTIGVRVSTRNGDIVASNQVDIFIYSPKIQIYEKDPLFGTLFGKRVGSEFILNREEIVLDVYPLFFSVDSKNEFNLIYNWSINGKQINGENNSDITFRQTGEEGVSNLSVNVRSTVNNFQSAFKKILIRFGGF